MTGNKYDKDCLSEMTLVLSGGWDDDDSSDEILEFVPRTGKWISLDTMKVARFGHAITTIPLADAKELCILA